MGLFPAIRPYATHSLAVDPPTRCTSRSAAIRACAGAVRARRAGRGLRALSSPFLRSGELPHRAVRPAWLRSFDAACQIAGNDTWALVADMERIREHLGVDRWLLFGGSWGSTLSLAYAETYPSACSVWCCAASSCAGRRKIHWFYQEGASRLFPDYWEEFLRPIPRPSAAICCVLPSPFDRRGRDRAHGGGQGLVALGGEDLDAAAAQEVIDHFSDPYTALSLARIRMPLFRQRLLPAARPVGARRLASPKSPASSFMVVTMWSVRSRTPGVCIRPGRAPSCASFRRRPFRHRARHPDALVRAVGELVRCLSRSLCCSGYVRLR